METKRLLESIRGKPKVKNGNQQGILLFIVFCIFFYFGCDLIVDKKQKSKESTSAQKPKKKKKLEGDGSGKNENIEPDKFKKFLPDGRSTVEILDDASPEGTPRQTDKVREAENAAKRVKLRELMGFEEPFGAMKFGDEKKRVDGKADTFVPYKEGISASDVDKEWSRLMKLEESARNNRKAEILDGQKRTNYLLKDRLAIRIQAAFRGHIGRKRFILKKKLTQLAEEQGKLGDWIQVSDPKTGDSWYFNRTTNQSQWEQPETKSKQAKMMNSASSKEKLPTISAKSDPKGASPLLKMKSKETGNTKNTLFSMSLPSLDATNLNKPATNVNQISNTATESDARREVEDILGIHKITKPDNLIAPNGYFKPQLRVTVQDALLETRFDSVSTVLADDRWYDKDEDMFATKAAKAAARAANGELPEESERATKGETKVDLSRAPLISTIVFNKKKSKAGKRLEASGEEEAVQATISSTKDLTFKDVEHPGFVDPAAVDATPLCFGCWSAGGKRKCVMHEDGGIKLKTSQTMLLCRNWDLSVMQRRYRSEEMQELFSKSEKALRFDVKHKKFSTIVEQKHPIYRLLSRIVDSFNSSHYLFVKIKRWLRSMFHQVRAGKVRQRGKFGAERIKAWKAEMTLVSHMKVVRYTKLQRHRLPIPPITGFSWPERQGTAQYIFKHVDKTHGEEVDLINIYPVPVPLKLYEPREYHASLPRSIPMPKPTYNEEVGILPTNNHIPEFHKAAWLERFCGAIVRDTISSAKVLLSCL